MARPAPGQPVQELVEGSLLANYPLDLFDLARYLPAGHPAAAASPVVSPETLGLPPSCPRQIAYDTWPAGRQALAPRIRDFTPYVGTLYAVALENLNPTQPADWPRTVSSSTRGFNPRIKRLSLAEKNELVEGGRQGVRAFFARK